MVAKILLAILGILLLLPGLCSIIFMGMFGTGGAGPLWILWLITFAIAWGGLELLRKAWRG
jgi:hypothetical protein